MNHHVFRLLVACLLGGGTVLFALPLLAHEKRPIPSAEAQQEAFKLIKEVYGPEWESQTLPAKLLEQAKASTDDEANHYMLLHVARDLAVQAGDAELAFGAIDAMAGRYDVDAYRLKGSALSRAAESASTGQSVAVARLALALIDEAVDRDDFVGARFLGKLALSAARKGRDGRLAGRIAERNTEVDALAAAFASVQEAKKTLIKDPVDPEANLAVGRYYCFDRGNWDRGLPYLALGNDETPKQLAMQELQGAADANEQVALGDGWWELAEASEGPAKRHLQARVVHWYRLAQPRLVGLVKVKVDERLKALEDIAQPAKEPAVTPLCGFAGRSEPHRARLLAEAGGTTESEAAVALALEWFAKHQLPDGSWSFDHTLAPSCRGQCGNPGNLRDARNAATAMALLPFLGAGQTHRTGKHRQNVQAGLYFLINNMKLSKQGGSLWEDGGRMYSHGLAAIAFTEAYGMTRDRSLLQPAQAVVNYICYAQDPVGGGWRYQPRQAGDTSVMSWQMAALKTAQISGLQVNPVVCKGASQFLDHVQASGGANYGYTGPGSGPATTAIGLLCRMQLGWNQDNPALRRGVEWIRQQGVSKSNMYYNYYATQVARHWKGDMWKKWNDQMHDWLVNSQVREGHQAGSWSFGGGGHSNERGGRHYITSLAALMLQAYYRHLPLHDVEGGK